MRVVCRTEAGFLCPVHENHTCRKKAGKVNDSVVAASLNSCYNLIMGMRSKLLGVALCAWLMLGVPGCSLQTPAIPSATAVTPKHTATASATVSPPTATATAAATATAVPTPTALTAPGPRLDAALVRTYPLPAATGDRISFDIEPDLTLGYEAPFTVTLALPDGRLLSSQVMPVGFDRQPRARFVWAWDTAGLTGLQSFTVTLLLPPDVRDEVLSDNVLTLAIALNDPTTLYPPEPGTRWDSQSTAGVNLHYVTGSAAERDVSSLLALAQTAYADVAARLDVSTTEVVDVYVLDRVVGQGGYATSDWVAVSYTDRAYAPSEMGLLLRHELTHRLDGVWGCDDLPAMFREGLAVLIAGGHYWPESLPRKAAALLRTGDYIPLEHLLDDFYRQQHEIGYLEAGALLAYVVEERGWEGVQQLCRAGAGASGDDVARLSSALAASGLPELPQLEKEWLRWLGALHVTEEERRLLQSEWLLMDTMRLYQQRYDPSANFLTGILFDPAMAMARDITEDFVRRPRNSEAMALELLLQMVQAALRAADPEAAEQLLAALTLAVTDPTSAPDTVVEMVALVSAVVARGYEPYRTVCVEEGRDVGQRAPGCVVYALDRAEWPTKRLLWAARAAEAGSWVVVGPQLER